MQPLAVATTRPMDDEIVISMNQGLTTATQEERNAAIAGLFIGLCDAIVKHGCSVDLSDPQNIRVTRGTT